MYEQPTFFENQESLPLAARLRPRTLSEFAGQTHLLGEGKVLRRLIESDKIQFLLKKSVVTVAGKNLTVSALTAGTCLVEGKVESVYES